MAITPAPAKFAAVLFAGEWQRGLEVAQRLGYDAIEVSLRDPQAQVVKDVARGIRDSRLVLSGVATGQNYYNDGLSPVSADPAVRARLLERMKGLIDFAAPWRATVFIGGVRGKLEGDPGTWADQRQRAVEAVRTYAEYALPAGVLLAIEPINRYETNYIHTVAEALQFIADVGAPNLVVLADTFHMNIEEVSIERALELAGEKLGYVHFVDSNRWAAGQGHIDFRSLAGVLRRMGYQGYISAEILPLPDSETAARLAIECFRSLQ